VDLPYSALISLHRRDLREITSRFAAIELLVTHEMEAIHRLEATTGRTRSGRCARWRATGRTQPRRRPTLCGGSAAGAGQKRSLL
jgi:hypothetical protein